MNCPYFKLIPEFDPAVYLNDEPIKWDQVQIIGKRDRDWHGFNYEYSDAEIQLEFDCTAGKSAVEAAFDADGPDALLILEFGYNINGVEHIEYQGKLNLKNRKKIEGRIACGVERYGLHDLIKTRWETKVNLFSNRSLDDQPIGNPSIIPVELHSKQLINNYNKKTGVTPGNFWQQLLGNEMTAWYILQDTTPETADNSNIAKTYGSQFGGSQFDPVTTGSALLFELEASGLFTFNIKLNYFFNTKLMRKAVSLKPKIGDWFLDNWLVIQDKAGVEKARERIGARMEGYVNDQYLTTGAPLNFVGSLTNFQISLVEGDKVFIYGIFDLDGFGAGWKGIEYVLYSSSAEFDIKAATGTAASYCKAMPAYEALDRNLAIITGNTGRLKSDFFGRPDLGYPSLGCGSLNLLTNGFQIRQFDSDNKPPQISLSEQLKSQNAIHCLGMGYEKDGGQDVMRIEKRDYFYQDVEILAISDCGDYTEDVAFELIPDNIEIGYSKYQDEGIRLLDEFNTRHEYVSAVKRSGTKFSQLSDLVTSGFAIETTRRSQFNKTPVDSTRFDDEVFLVAVKERSAANISVVFSSEGYIQIASGFQVLIGQKISVDGSAFNDGTFTVFSILGNRFYLQEPVVNEISIVNVRNVTEPFVTEKDESFNMVNNLIGPESAYNLRHSPKRMLLRWAKWLNGGMKFKSAGERVRNTFFKQNGDLTTQMKNTEPCHDGDPFFDTIMEKEDVGLGAFDDRRFIFLPDWVKFKTRLSKQELTKIKLAMTGQDTDGKNYGFITVIDPDGNGVQGWIYDMIYNPNTEGVSFTLLKKKVLLQNNPSQENCQDYSNWTFAMFEASNIGAFIEQCRFSNFN